MHVTHLISAWCTPRLPCHTGLACPGGFRFLQVLLADGGFLVGHNLEPGSQKPHPDSPLPLIAPPLLSSHLYLASTRYCLYFSFVFFRGRGHICATPGLAQGTRTNEL